MRRSVVVLVLLLAIGTVVFRFAVSKLSPRPVAMATVSRGRVVEAIYGTGRVDCDQRATVRARITAPLAELLVGPGEEVRRGQIIGRQENTEVLSEVEKRNKELAAATAALAEARDAAARARALFEAGLLPENELVRQRERAQELTKRAEALNEALAMAQERARWAELRSPLDGTVAALYRRAGDLLREGDEVLLVVDLRQPYLRVAVDERDLGRVQKGQEVRIVFDAYPEQIFKGTVWRVVPTVDRLTRSADVLVQLPSERPRLQLDLSATVNIVIRIVEDALVVPRTALKGEGRSRSVLRLAPNGTLEAVAVDVGACDLERCQIVSGLQQGEKIAADASGLAAGTAVRPQ